MDIEQLKLVLETVKQLGAQGKEAFIWWVVLSKALPIIGWLLTLPCIMTVIYWIIRANRSSIEDTNRLHQLRDQILQGSYSCRYISDSEFKVMLDKVHELKIKRP